MNLNTNVQVKTPFNRLLAGGILGGIGLAVATTVPLTLLLPYKLMSLNPNDYSAVFGYINGIAGIMALIFGPIWGIISDRTVSSFGRRRLWLLAAMVGIGFSLIGIGLATSVTQVAVCWIVLNIFSAAGYGMNGALVADQVDENHRGTYGGITGLVNPAGVVLGMGLINILSSKSTGFKFYLIAVIAVVGIIFQVLLIKEGKWIYVKKAKEKRTFSEFLSGVYPSPRKYPAFTWGVITRLLLSVLGNLGTYYTIMLLQRFHFSQEEATSKMAIVSMVSIIFLAVAAMLGGILSDKLRKQKVFIIASSILFFISLFIEAFASGFNIFLLGACLGNFAYGVFISVSTALMIRLLPNQQDAGKDMGIINLPTGLAAPIVSFISPIILSVTSWTEYYIIFAVIAIISIFTVMPIPEIPSKPVKEEQIY